MPGGPGRVSSPGCRPGGQVELQDPDNARRDPPFDGPAPHEMQHRVHCHDGARHE